MKLPLKILEPQVMESITKKDKYVYRCCDHKI